MAERAPGTANYYRIGAVSRMTGISPEALRIWERRYAAVSPLRSSGGGRLYSALDVERLYLMKQLVDAGDAIGTVASLDRVELQGRTASAQRARSGPGVSTRAAECRVLLVGEALSREVPAGDGAGTGITIAARYADTADFEACAGAAHVDMLVIEQATLHEDTARRVMDWLNRAKAVHALVVYRYASAEALRRLPDSKCTALRAPLDARTLEAHCASVMHTATIPRVPGNAAVMLRPAPPPRYDDETLSQLAAQSSAVKCECPSHLAELIATLSGFERYSAECESRSTRDAALHAYLHATASQARRLIEDALDRVIEVEGINISGAAE
jgi:DNA-binding transcriptional MerR regulator